jgi:hypothetical protein
MTATHATTDRSRSVTTACSPRRPPRHRAKPHGIFQSKPLRASAPNARPRASNPARTPAHTRRYRSATPFARRLVPLPSPLAVPSLRLSLLSQVSLLSPPPQSVICPTTALVHTRPSTLHQLLPVPGPDPARLPLWWLGGVRVRHRPQTPYSSTVGCGREIHGRIHISGANLDSAVSSGR